MVTQVKQAILEQQGYLVTQVLLAKLDLQESLAKLGIQEIWVNLVTLDYLVQVVHKVQLGMQVALEVQVQ